MVERICKNCKYWERVTPKIYGVCNGLTKIQIIVTQEFSQQHFETNMFFGCNQFEKNLSEL